MLRKAFTLTIICVLYLSVTIAHSCVGRTLYVGAMHTPSDKIMSEMLALLINERTGTTVQTRFFDSREALYTALKSNVEEERIDILVEDTIDAMQVVKQTADKDQQKNFLTVKAIYEKDLGVIWLNPFGFSNSQGGGESISSPLVRRDVLTNFPLLPRVLNKLAGAITNKSYDDLNQKVTSGEKPKNAAKDFLKKKKFI